MDVINLGFVTIVVLLSIYILVSYVYTYDLINTLTKPRPSVIQESVVVVQEVVTTEPPKIYTETELRNLLEYVLETLKAHTNEVIDPHFYDENVHVLLSNHPWYEIVFVFIRALNTSSYDINTLLIGLLGHNYFDSPKLNVYICMGTYDKRHNFLSDIENAFYLEKAEKIKKVMSE